MLQHVMNNPYLSISVPQESTYSPASLPEHTQHTFQLCGEPEASAWAEGLLQDHKDSAAPHAA